jgi:hypothetical protein
MVVSAHSWQRLQDYSDESLIMVQQALRGLLPTKDGAWEQLTFNPSQPAAAATGTASASALSAAGSTTSMTASYTQGSGHQIGGSSLGDASEQASRHS